MFKLQLKNISHSICNLNYFITTEKKTFSYTKTLTCVSNHDILQCSSTLRTFIFTCIHIKLVEMECSGQTETSYCTCQKKINRKKNASIFNIIKQFYISINFQKEPFFEKMHKKFYYSYSARFV